MERIGSYRKNAIITFSASITNLALGVLLSVVIARSLGPEGKGIYTVVTLFSSLIVTLGSLGFPSGAAFYVAKRSYTRQEILGNSVLVSLLMALVGIIVGLITIITFGRYVFPGVSQGYLLLALLIIPGNMLLIHLQYILLGAQHIKGYNLAAMIQGFLSLIFTILFLWIFRMEVGGALLGIVFSWIFADIFTFVLTAKVSNGFKMQMNISYLKNALSYGLKIHIGNILRFLSLRVNLFLVNVFLNPAAVGFYSISVGLTEKLWLISQAAATVLFPKIAGEEDEVKKKEFTPIVARTVLWIMVPIALLIFFLSRWLVSFLYSQTFLPAVASLRILLLGTVAGGLSQILGNDIAGRGQPILNIYANIAGFISVIVLSILWVPKYGIEGAAWASSASYITNMFVLLLFYNRISGNSFAAVLLPKISDWNLYWKTGKALWRQVVKSLRSTKAFNKGRVL